MSDPTGNNSINPLKSILESHLEKWDDLEGKETKIHALIFSGLFLLVFLILLGLFEEGAGSGIAARHLMGRLKYAGTEICWDEVPAFLLLGTAAGCFGGMLGLGGGVLKVAGMLLFFNMDIFFVRAVSLTTMFFTAASAIWPYARRGFIMPRIIKAMLPLSLTGVLAGVFLGNHLRGATLTHFFGFFVLFLGLYTLAMVFADPQEHVIKKNFSRQLDQQQKRFSQTIGIMHGFICGLLGISGGVISVPMQQLLLNMPTRSAIANTLVISAICSGLGSIIVIAFGTSQGLLSLNQVLFASLWIGAGAVLGAQIGVQMGVKSHTGLLRLLFVIISFAAGLSLMT